MNADGESPFFLFDWLDEIYFQLLGVGASEWLDGHVNRMIIDFTAKLEDVPSLRPTLAPR